MIGVALALLLSEPAVSNPPIEVPPDVTPAWAAYRHCVFDHFGPRVHFAHNLEEARQAWAVGDCRDVRALQLQRALAARVDRRIYGDRENVRAIIHRAFDRFDSEFNMQWNDDPAQLATGSPKENDAQN